MNMLSGTSKKDKIELGGLAVPPLALRPPAPDYYGCGPSVRVGAPKYAMNEEPVPAAVAHAIISGGLIFVRAWALRAVHVQHERQIDQDLTFILVFCINADEMVLDGRPRLNLASFVTTRMEKEAEDLMQVCCAGNFHVESPEMAEV
jgi:hypothetical protein